MTTHGRRSPSTTSPVAARLLSLAGVVLLGVAVALPGSPAAASVVAKVQLGTVDQFGVLAGSTVTNTGPTVLNGQVLGVSPGTAVTGFPPGLIVPPVLPHKADGVAGQAQSDATTAFNQAAGLPADNPVAFTELGGKTLLPGVYQGNLSLTGTVTLDNGNNPDAVFVFQASSTLITASSSVVTFTNAAHPSCNVFWQVGSSATLGTNSVFVGTIDALTTITAGTTAKIQGRLIARNGAVNLHSNTITRAPCATSGGGGGPTTPTTPTTTPTTPSTTPTTPTTPSTTPTTSTTKSTTPTTPSTGSTTPTTTAPPAATTTGQSLTIIRTTPTTARATTTQATTRATTSRATTTSRTTTTTDQTSTDVYGSSTESTYSTDYTDTYVYDTATTESTEALGIDTGTGGGDQLAATGPRVTGLLFSGSLLLFGGVVVLMFARRRAAPGRHRHL